MRKIVPDGNSRRCRVKKRPDPVSKVSVLDAAPAGGSEQAEACRVEDGSQFTKRNAAPHKTEYCWHLKRLQR